MRLNLLEPRRGALESEDIDTRTGGIARRGSQARLVRFYSQW